MLRITKLLSRAKPKKLCPLKIDQQLSELSNSWSYNKSTNSIKKCYNFKNFNQAFAFLTRIALQAEKKIHHPEIYNCYNKVELGYTTHDVDGLSELDFEMAQFSDKIYDEFRS